MQYNWIMYGKSPNKGITYFNICQIDKPSASHASLAFFQRSAYNHINNWWTHLSREGQNSKVSKWICNGMKRKWNGNKKVNLAQHKIIKTFITIVYYCLLFQIHNKACVFSLTNFHGQLEKQHKPLLISYKWKWRTFISFKGNIIGEVMIGVSFIEFD